MKGRTAPNAPLTGVEYIIAKSITRPLVTIGTWNANFHNHRLEIATGRVRRRQRNTPVESRWGTE